MHNIGKYTILEELGRGAFATVFRARDTVLQRDVALKVLHPPLLADPDFMRRFEADARTAAQLEHPHIVTIHDLGQAETRYYIAMQYLSGGTLADRLKSGPLPWGDAVRIVAEIAEALDFVHARGLIHRDVKPTNILFNARGEAVLADFGLVKAVESSSVARSSTGGVIGTPAYLAPEVWEGKPASPATDVYALGCVLFEMLTGTVLFKGDTTPAVMRAHFLPHEYPATWPEGVPPEVQNLLERALSADPAARATGAGQLAAGLRALADHAATKATQRAAATDLTGFRKPIRSAMPVWAWGVGVLLLIIALIGGSQLLRRATVSPLPTATVAVTKMPQPTATPTVTSAPTSTPTATPTVMLTPTATPTATSTAAPTTILTPTATWAPTPTHTVIPTRKACSFTLPTLVSPGNEATLPAGWFDAVFNWTGGTLCAGQQWVVVISGNGSYQTCPAGNAGSVTCKLPDLAGTYSWAVEVRNSAGGSVTSGRTQFRTLFLALGDVTGTATPDNGGGGGGESPPETRP